MKNVICSACVFLFFISVGTSVSFSKSPLFINRIEGMVYDPNRIPINDVRIELLNEVGSPILNTKTFSGGRFTFTGITQGHFIVRVIPVGFDFLEETKDVEIVNMTRNGSDTVYLDFYLRYDRRNRPVSDNKPAGTVFVQEIAPTAKKLYQSGGENLKKNPEKGIFELEEALKIFPDYFDVLSLLGREYISRKEFDKAAPYLTKAVAVNPRSAIDFYRLGLALNQTKQYPTALEAAKSAATIVPDSIDAQLLYGTLLRITKDYTEAEKTLLKANVLAKEKNSDVHWQLALLYNRTNKNQAAVAELETFLRLEPNSPDREKIQELIEKLKNSKQN